MLLASALLAVAITVEVASTAALPRAEGFTDVPWTTAVLMGYAISIALLSVVVQRIPVGVTYAVWSGAGTALVAVVAAVWLKEPLNLMQVGCLVLIILGVIGLNLTGAH